ncbi:UDP-N-acetylglucosamine 2-epimerase [Gammaproteobacteria bacterium]|nr:UDP-N-acetylglucosamine 2-epimerase [Gammaproteobacteria bacterium]MDA9258789.1 UDP-N-acetylglucosamine 2-epimerase [Gammaproteobacteria bacterium]
MTKARNLLVVTTSRAEYGILKRLMHAINVSSAFNLQIIVSGSHLSEFHGNTFQEIEADNFNIDSRVELKLENDQPQDIAHSFSLGIQGFSEELSVLKPDLMIILGDRYEILSAAIAAMFLKIPIAHLHGGETTEGAIDESIRHAVTKLSHFHFAANINYRHRILQLGENPDNVFLVGGLGVDAIYHTKLLSKTSLEKNLGFKFKKKNLLVTFHPQTLAQDSGVNQLNNLLSALSLLENTQLIFTMPNADPNNKAIHKQIQNFVMNNKNSISFDSLGQLKYFSCVSNVDAVVGNSSSGIAEVPSFKKGTIDIGDRQKGRIKAQSVISCSSNTRDISKAIQKIYTKKFQDNLIHTVNPYGDGGAVDKIMNILPNISLEEPLQKPFFDIK